MSLEQITQITTATTAVYTLGKQIGLWHWLHNWFRQQQGGRLSRGRKPLRR